MDTTASDAPQAASAGTGRRIAYWTVLVLTTILATVAIFAVWANRQLLNTDNWTETSTKLLQNQAIRDQTATYLTDQLYANVDVQGEIQGFLPTELQPLAAPAAGAVRNVVDDVAGKALQNPTVQQAWSDANRTAHQGLVNVIEDKGTYTSINGDTVEPGPDADPRRDRRARRAAAGRPEQDPARRGARSRCCSPTSCRPRRASPRA